jgi:hypothetical protein
MHCLGHLSLWNYETKSLWKTDYQISCICVYIYIYFFLVKFFIFGFILKKSAAVATNFRWSWDCMMACLVHIEDTWPDAWEWNAIADADYQNCLQPKYLTMAYCSYGCFIDNRVSYWHVGWICTSFESSTILWMNELCDKSYLFFQMSTAKVFSCTDYETITKMTII